MIFEEEMDQTIEDHIDLTPLIDAMFLLLIFFIMATTFSKPVMDVMLPHAESSAESASTKEQVVITIDAEGRIFHTGEAVSEDELSHLMTREMALPLNLYVDEKAPFQSFVKALDQARLNKREEIVVTTDPAK
ncbi:MAG: ExbD/TolR family protein [Desulfococcaceae bacterium]